MMMNLEQQKFQQQQQQRGILPAQILNALDILVDRLNASSGYNVFGVRTSSTGVATATAAAANLGDGTTNISVLAANAAISGVPLPLNSDVADGGGGGGAGAGDDAPPPSIINTNNNNPPSSPPIKALLVGTNEGVGLSRSLGTLLSTSSLIPSVAVSRGGESGNFNSMSEEILSTIETVWATLPSAVPPHVMASVVSSSTSSPNDTTSYNTTTHNEDNNNNNNLNHHQPPHPLLSPLQMGSIVKTTTAIYSNCIVMHVHFPPLVVTLLMSPEVNLGAVRNILFGGKPNLGNETNDQKKGILEVLLEPVRRALVRSRCGAIGNTINNDMMTMMSMQAQQQEQLQLQSMQIILPMDPYQQQQQQMMLQQQMMMARQRQQ